MNAKCHWDKALVITHVLVLFAPSAVRLVRGNGGGGSLSARTTLQRTVDSSGAGPSGSATLRKSGTKQSFQLQVRDLAGESFGLFVGLENGFDTNLVQFIAPLNKRTNDRWVLEYSANTGMVPVQFSDLCVVDGDETNCVTDIEQLAGFFLFVANPTGQTNVVCDEENIICVTNEMAEVTCTTNCVTNVTVGSVLVAEVPALVPAAGLFNTKGKVALLPPAIPPNPKARGSLNAKFSATQGRSLLDIRASGLFGGQVYSLWMSDEPGGLVVSHVATLTQPRSSSGFYKRDTKLGETLPMLVSTVTNLSGFNVEIRDAFNATHLEGTIP
jgi:hypothetical protein